MEPETGRICKEILSAEPAVEKLNNFFVWEGLKFYKYCLIYEKNTWIRPGPQKKRVEIKIALKLGKIFKGV